MAIMSSYCFASFSTAVDFIKQFRLRKKKEMKIDFKITKKRTQSLPSLGMEGWKEQTLSVFNDLITQTSLEQSSKDLTIKRMPTTTPRSVVSHVVNNTQDDFWWSQDLEARLQ